VNAKMPASLTAQSLRRPNAKATNNLKRFLREGLKNTSVTCVLVGAGNSSSAVGSVRNVSQLYAGNGLLAVRVHTIGGLNRATSEAGATPLLASHRGGR